MRPNTLTDTLIKLYKQRRPVWIRSEPGTGKTTLTRGVAERLDGHYVHKHGPTMLVEDFGIMYPDNEKGVFRYYLPEWFPCEGSKYDDGRPVILCFDDASQCNHDTQKVMANIIQERELHGKRLLDTVMVVMTGNFQKDRAGANRLLSHLANRVTFLNFDVHIDDWTEFAIDPRNDVPQEIVSFIRYQPDLLMKFDPDEETNPSPRSWVDGVGSAIKAELPPDAELEAIAGAVGEGAAATFLGYLRIARSLPDPDRVLKDPSGVPVPSDTATCYALAGALSHRVNPDNMDNFVKFINRMSGDLSMLAMTMAAKRNPALKQTSAFAQWAIKNQDLLF